MKSLEITTRVSCPIRCHFCPQDKLKGAYTSEIKAFTLNNLRLCLSSVPEDVRIDFSGYAEPFSNRICGSLIQHAVEQGYKVHLYTTLIGIDEVSASLLRMCRPEHVKIHVPDVKGMIIPDAVWLKAHDIWLQTGIKAHYMAMGELTPAVAGELKSLNLEVEKPVMLSRGGNLWDIGKKQGRVLCAADRWHQNVLMPNGDVYLDCMDYSLTTPLGNLVNQRYSDIYHEADRLKNNEQPPAICLQCEWASVG